MFYLFMLPLKWESLDQVEERKEQLECPEGKNATIQCRERQKLLGQKL